MKRSSIKSRVEAGELLVIVMGSPDEIARARSIIENTGHVDLNQFQKAA
jgi:ParB-like chromosome segregation protein Spo0J